MTDNLVKRLRSQIGDDVQEVYLHEPLFALAADRIEALTAKCEALGQEVNMAKYGQPDFAWSIHVEAMADLKAECAEAAEKKLQEMQAHIDHADAYHKAMLVAEADNARLREALTVDPWGLGWRKWQAHAATVLNLSPREETK